MKKLLALCALLLAVLTLAAPPASADVVKVQVRHGQEVLVDRTCDSKVFGGHYMVARCVETRYYNRYNDTIVSSDTNTWLTQNYAASCRYDGTYIPCQYISYTGHVRWGYDGSGIPGDSLYSTPNFYGSCGTGTGTRCDSDSNNDYGPYGTNLHRHMQSVTGTPEQSYCVQPWYTSMYNFTIKVAGYSWSPSVLYPDDTYKLCDTTG